MQASPPEHKVWAYQPSDCGKPTAFHFCFESAMNYIFVLSLNVLIGSLQGDIQEKAMALQEVRVKDVSSLCVI